jgi:DNA-binding IclR family transcriptional regulator
VTLEAGRPGATRSSGGIQSVAKSIDILEILSKQSRGLALGEVAERLGFNQATTHHLIATLRERGLVDQDPATKRYRIGTGLLALANRFIEGLDVVSTSYDFLLELRDRSGETAYLAAHNGSRLIQLVQLPGWRPIQARRELHGNETNLHSTASGKLLLAYLAPAQAETLIGDAELPRFTPNTLVEPAALLAELETIRTHGYALDREENIEGVMCVAAPVLDRHGSCIADVSIALPRADAARLDDLIPMVLEAGRGISARLGHG